LRDRYRSVLADLDRQHAKAQTEYQAIMESARVHADQMTEAAGRKQAETDTLAERERVRIEREFQASISARRAELDRELETRRAAALAQARQTVAAAQQEAQRLLAEANAEVAHLAGVREQLTKRLRATSELLGRSTDLLEPTEAEAAAAT
jgi:F0F1-type ATP synthase membrane subunit b/b'